MGRARGNADGLLYGDEVGELEVSRSPRGYGQRVIWDVAAALMQKRDRTTLLPDVSAEPLLDTNKPFVLWDSLQQNKQGERLVLVLAVDEDNRVNLEVRQYLTGMGIAATWKSRYRGKSIADAIAAGEEAAERMGSDSRYFRLQEEDVDDILRDLHGKILGI